MKLRENSKKSYSPMYVLRVCYPFGLRVSFIFIQVCSKIRISLGEKLSKIEIAYLLSSFV